MEVEKITLNQIRDDSKYSRVREKKIYVHTSYLRGDMTRKEYVN